MPQGGLPGFEKLKTSVTFVMKILPFSCSLAFLFLILGPVDRVLSFLSLVLLGVISLQHSNMHSNR